VDLADDTLVDLLVRLGPGWGEVVAGLRSLADAQPPLVIWQRICHLTIRAETVRVVPGAPRGEAVPLAREYRERLEAASEWVLEHGLKCDIPDADWLVVAVSHLRSRLGLGRADTGLSARIGTPRRFRPAESLTPVRTEDDMLAALQAFQTPNGKPTGGSAPGGPAR
jgi:hypothetical protein